MKKLFKIEWDDYYGENYIDQKKLRSVLGDIFLEINITDITPKDEDNETPV